MINVSFGWIGLVAVTNWLLLARTMVAKPVSGPAAAALENAGRGGLHGEEIVVADAARRVYGRALRCRSH